MVKMLDTENEIQGFNTIANGSSIEGNITSKSDCRIDGNIKGNINCSAKVIVGENGIIEGDINCQSIEIAGKVKANIVASDLISPLSTAVLGGDITSSKLSIEPGATFVGKCQIQQNAKAPQAARPEEHANN